MAEAVTVLVPNFNGARFLVDAIPRLLAQDHPDFRIVVLDNRSTDDSLEVVSRFADRRLEVVRFDEHVSILANINRGMERVETPLLAACAVDEVYEPQWLSTLGAILGERRDAFVACVKADSVDEWGRRYLAPQERHKHMFWPAGEPAYFDPRSQVRDLQLGNYLILTTCLFRTDAVRRIGPFDESLTFVGDWQYWLRGLFAGYVIAGTHRPLVHYRRHSGMMTLTMKGSLEAFEQEAALCEWIAETGHAEGFLPSPEPDYSLVCKTVLARLTSLLRGGEAGAADELLTFAFRRVPGIGTTPLGRLMRVARRCGRLGGLALAAGAALYLRLPALARDWRPARGLGRDRGAVARR